MSLAIVIPILILCLLVEGFFSGSEMAFVNADKYKLAISTDAGSKLARLALRVLKHPSRFFSTTLLGTNLSTVAGSVVSTFYIIDNYGRDYVPFALLFWPAALIFGEIIPKAIYQRHADRMVLYMAPPLLFFSFLAYPVVWPLSKFTDSLLGQARKTSDSLTRDDLEIIIESGTEGASDVRPSEKTLISRIFDLEDKKVENIMTPLVDVVALPVSVARREAERALAEHAFSRVPVYEDRFFNIVGVLFGSDFIFHEEEKPVRELMRKAYFVPEEMPLDELLVSMKRKGEEIAVAVDEYGAATGVVTVEDILEEVVGEIRDEHDDKLSLFTRMGKHRYVVSGRMEIEDANHLLKLEIPYGDYETVAGFVISNCEHIPKVGESFTSGKFVFKVLRSTDRAVLEVEVIRRG
ncbi:MAG TPA: hemolysin family protein [bacterium]|nr:HlyC/CorC family transporter [Myxococcales bacterium]OQA61033.1 MAG: Hemolysin C [bacterium ADurb.Bin270]HPW44921.1 hemolysin family protein [bacterium]HQG12771.1 hemolysin family protein [bacterium]